MLCEWRIRKKGSKADPYVDYGAFLTVFCLKINHGGAFTPPPKIRYKDGKVNWVDTIDSDVFSVVEVNNIMKELDVIEDVSEDEWLQKSLRLVGIKKKHAVENDNVRGQSSRNESMNVEDDRDDGSNSDDGSTSDDDSDSQDSDFLVNPDNMIDDVDVDMTEFKSNIDANVEWVGSKAIFGCKDGDDDSGSKGVVSSGLKGKGQSKEKGQVSGSKGKSNNKTKASGGIKDKGEYCPWSLQCSKLPNEETWVVKTIKDTHKYLQSRIVKKCTASFLSKFVEESIKPNPKIPLNALKDQLQKQYKVWILKQNVFKAKKMAQERVEGPLKDGFKAGKRDLLGLDGCFLSGSYPGWIFTAVGVDPNNGIYPFACAIVESENKDSWKWFLEQLVDGRDKPIITCLEFIREYLMKRIVNVHKVISKSDGPLTPNATKVFNIIVKEGQMKSTIPNTIVPPKIHPQNCRPPKKRKKSAVELAEGMVKGNKLSKVDGLRERPKPVHVHLAMSGPCQCDPWLSPGPLICLVGPRAHCGNTAQADGSVCVYPHSDPTKVQVRKRDLADREVKLLKITEGRTVALDPPATAAPEDSGDSIDQLFDEGNDAGREHSVKKGDNVLEEAVAKNASEAIAENPRKSGRKDGKSLDVLRGMILEGSDIPSGVTEPFLAASVAPTSDVGPVDCVSGLNLRTSPPHERYVVSSDGSHHSGSHSEATSFVRFSVADAPVVTVAVTTTVDADVAAGSKAKDISIDFENIGDFASAGGMNVDTLCAMDYDQLYSEFNVGPMRQVCLGVEVRMRAKHTSEKKGELEDKCAEQTTLISERNTEIAHLKSLLSLKEAEVAEAISLRNQLSVVGAADAAKSTELRDLKEKNFSLEGERDSLSDKLSHDELNSKVASLESERDCLENQKNSLEAAFELFRERIEALQDEQVKALGDRSPEYLQALGQAIGCTVNKGIQDGLKAEINHGKARRDLSVVEAYDPSAEGKYVDDVNTLGAVDFSFLSELESKKDASIIDLMDSLCFEGVLAEILGAEDLQPSPAQLMLPIHRPEDNVVFVETSLSSSLEIVSLRVQRFREETKEKHLSLTGVMTPFVEPLSSRSLTDEAYTSATPITTLLTTFSSFFISPPNQALDSEPHGEDPPLVTFETKELSTSLE
nr:hypothetical protein [Tanacetum cinerariifolium]